MYNVLTKQPHFQVFTLQIHKDAHCSAVYNSECLEINILQLRKVLSKLWYGNTMAHTTGKAESPCNVLTGRNTLNILKQA